MNNRPSSAPILCALVLSLVLPSPSGRAQSSSPPPSPAPSAPAVASTGTATNTTPATPAPAAPKVHAIPHTITYTVVAGDTLTGLAKKFNTTRRHLEALNDLPGTKLKPGEVLLIPYTKKSTASVKPKHAYLAAQPVQDFDVPASTFGSCPVPVPSQEDEDTNSSSSNTSSSAPSDTSSDTEKPAPIAKLVSPAEAEAEEQKLIAQAEREQAAAQAKVAAKAKPAPQTGTSFASSENPGNGSTSIFSAPLPLHSTPPRSNNRSVASGPVNPRLMLNPYTSLSADQWADRFLRQARLLGDQGIEYDDDWCPPGERRSWTMDCSNTSRYLYKVTAGILLPRTASDQYYYLHLQGKAWDVPTGPSGWADTDYLQTHLRPGDLLFWENTYRPERQPPITHVMIFLGTNDRGQWIMAGSQGSRGGEHNRRGGGPDIYIFRPNQPCGGYTTWMGLVHHQGRFCAYGRPLDADRTKLSVATDD